MKKLLILFIFCPVFALAQQRVNFTTAPQVYSGEYDILKTIGETNLGVGSGAEVTSYRFWFLPAINQLTSFPGPRGQRLVVAQTVPGSNDPRFAGDFDYDYGIDTGLDLSSDLANLAVWVKLGGNFTSLTVNTINVGLGDWFKNPQPEQEAILNIKKIALDKPKLGIETVIFEGETLLAGKYKGEHNITCPDGVACGPAVGSLKIAGATFPDAFGSSKISTHTRISDEDDAATPSNQRVLQWRWVNVAKDNPSGPTLRKQILVIKP